MESGTAGKPQEYIRLKRFGKKEEKLTNRTNKT
jgi:hypothetical protein